MEALTSKERELIKKLVDEGYCWVARDYYGLFAFRKKPIRIRGAWGPAFDDSKVVKLLKDYSFYFVTYDDKEPWEIGCIQKGNDNEYLVFMKYTDDHRSRYRKAVLRPAINYRKAVLRPAINIKYNNKLFYSSIKMEKEKDVDYTDQEKQLAKDLYQKKYRYLSRDRDGYLWAYHNRPEKSDYNVWLTNGETVGNALQICNNIIPLFQNVAWSDSEPLKILDVFQEKILDDIEIQYLENFLRPFRNHVKSITKSFSTWYDKNGEPQEGENLIISMRGERWDIYLPHFTKNYMYKGMKRGQKYTLDELGLFAEEA